MTAKISYFHKLIGPNGPMPNDLQLNFSELSRLCLPVKAAESIPIGAFGLNSFFIRDPRFQVAHFATSQPYYAPPDSLWIYELYSLRGFCHHGELALSSFWGGVWDSLPQNTRDDVTHGRMSLHVTNLPEDATPSVIVNIIEALRGDAPSLRHVHVCVSGMYSTRAREWIHRQTGRDIVQIPYFELMTIEEDRSGKRPALSQPSEKVDRSKRYILMNRRIDKVPHRVAMFLELLRRNVIDQGHIGMIWQDLNVAEKTFRHRVDELERFPQSPKRDELLKLGRETFRAGGAGILPKVLDARFLPNSERMFSRNADYHSNTIADFFADSYFSVVLECVWQSGGDDEQDSFALISEKTFFAMMNYHFFVVAGEPGTLQRLRDYGYKTFHEWIDESYDQIEDPIERFTAVGQVVDNLCKMPIDQLEKMVREMRPTLIHNRQHMFARVDSAVERVREAAASQADVRRGSAALV